MYQLDHPNILRLFGVVQEDAQLNVFVEWMAGGSIARWADKIPIIGVKVQNMKMDFNTGGPWRRVGQ